jgi:hypothetical protein
VNKLCTEIENAQSWHARAYMLQGVSYDEPRRAGAEEEHLGRIINLQELTPSTAKPHQTRMNIGPNGVLCSFCECSQRRNTLEASSLPNRNLHSKPLEPQRNPHEH